jgi:hypothetical protein
MKTWHDGGGTINRLTNPSRQRHRQNLGQKQKRANERSECKPAVPETRNSRKSQSACISTFMNFTTWLLHKKDLVPPPDWLVLLIRAAGANGITEGELRSAVDSPKKLVDDLLRALISAGQVSVATAAMEAIPVRLIIIPLFTRLAL